MKGTVVKRPALPMRIFRRTWWTRTNLLLISMGVHKKMIGETHFTECVEDGISLSTCWDWRTTIHLHNSSSTSLNDIREASDDLGEWTLADDDERTVDDGDGLSRCLEGLALCGEHLDVVDHLSGSDSCSDGSCKGQSGSKEVSDGNHFYGGERSFRFGIEESGEGSSEELVVVSGDGAGWRVDSVESRRPFID